MPRMSDLPPYLTHNPNRRVAWKGHDVFPRNVVRIHSTGDSWGAYGYLRSEDLRIFKREFGPGGVAYYLMSEEEAQKYMEDPTRV